MRIKIAVLLSALLILWQTAANSEDDAGSLPRSAGSPQGGNVPSSSSSDSQLDGKEDAGSPQEKKESAEEFVFQIGMDKPAEKLQMNGSAFDYGPYMLSVTRRIRAAWYPPKGRESKKMSVRFSIYGDGALNDLRISKSSGDVPADNAAIAAVNKAAPFRPLPQSVPDHVTVDFSFDYSGYGQSPKSQSQNQTQTVPVPMSSPQQDQQKNLLTQSRSMQSIQPVATAQQLERGSQTNYPNITIVSRSAQYVPSATRVPIEKTSAAGPSPKPDFGLYLKDLNRRIKRAWFPPRKQEMLVVIVEFSIGTDGRLSDLRVVRSSGSVPADQAALAAVENAAPFRPLPAFTPSWIKVRFIFDYNLFEGGRSF